MKASPLKNSIILALSFVCFQGVSRLPLVSGSSSLIETPSITCANTSHTPYPDRDQIATVFAHLTGGNFTAFLTNVVPNVDWTIMGTHPLAGRYHNRTVFANALERLSYTYSAQSPPVLSVVNIFGGGCEAWSVVELHALGICKNGRCPIDI